MAGLGCQKRGVRIARVMKAEGGSAAEDMSTMHEAMEPEMEEAKETKLEKEGYKETKSGKMVKDAAKGFKEGVKKLVNTPVDAAKKVSKSLEKLNDPKFRKAAGIGQPYMGPFRKEYKKGGQAKVSKVMREFGRGKLHSGKKGPVVKSRKQAIAIALSEAGMSKRKK